MKKAITILAVLIVLVGAVFAADGTKETHTIRLKTDVEGLAPAFQLTFVSGQKAQTSGVSTTNNGQTPATYNYEAQADPNYTGADIEVDDISKGNISVTFNVLLANEAKQLQDYQLTLKAGPFNVKKNGAAAYVKPASAVISNVAPAARLGVVAKNAYDVAKATDQETGEISESVGLHFNGTTCATGALATYVVGYNQDTAVDPNPNNNPAQADNWYYANIALEVVSK